jgi:uncharacterized protein (TIGR03083 family)
MTDDHTLLAGLWRTWAGAGSTLTPSDWSAPTRNDGWNVHALYAHVARGVERLAAFSADVVTSGADHRDATAYFAQFRSWGEQAAATQSAETLRYASERDPEQLVQLFAEDGPRVLDEVARSADRIVRTQVGSIPLSGYVATRVVEAAVHLLDLRAALGQPVPDDDPGLLGPGFTAVERHLDPNSLAGCAGGACHGATPRRCLPGSALTPRA